MMCRPVRPYSRLLVLAAAIVPAFTVAPGTAAEPAATLALTITGIKSDKGVIRLALCPQGAAFPDCRERAVRSAALPIAKGSAQTELTGLAPGTYAVSVFHDANGNGKLDTFAGVPKEGYGFSRNPPFRPRAPRFAEAQVAVSGRTAEVIGLRYLF